ncbi:tryptophan halogenase family protein [Bowmanella dokdonensis]|uniref:Tryptophan 7-halogenase n=1 Tax=Bowmanella dokdonensis TaxID=751969 RepID=A0A939IMW8_9ALTE|nr:tryptophan halogenase family protein [Bowmanella dokdonensis]MBN7824235.1 tryptophan 7-halogenase [Bowmanella dokdonensis]
MNTAPQRTLTIVGGGAAGWMTAIYLNRYFNAKPGALHIRVVESPDIGIIGVGEATVHSIRFFFAAMGLDERELMQEANGTLKSGILFRNWMKPVNGRTHEYFHPFEANLSGSQLDISSSWFASGTPGSYDEAVCTSVHLIRDGLCAKGKNSRAYDGVVPYGYHLDATLMARFLRRKAVQSGVEHIEATVSEVETQGDHIQAVVTDKGRIDGDIFVDCTGFRGLLMEALQQNNWQSFADALPCNKAVAIQKAYADSIEPRPYTQATALTNGWAWQIDLTNRQGTGYVYDGNRLSPEQAEAELRDFIGTGGAVLKAVHLDMKVGRRKQFWVGNCIAMGLAGGFIEPLESTGLHVINIGARLLATHLSSSEISQPVRDSYNELMIGVYEDLKQFIVLHYCLTDRDDTDFWRQAKASVEHCPALKQKLAVWKHKVCEYLDLAGSYATTFTDENYRYVLYGMQHYPDLALRPDPEQIEQVFARGKQKVEMARQQALPHAAYLKAIGTLPV